MSQLHYAYLVPGPDGWRLMGQSCVAGIAGHTPVTRWKTVLDNRHPLVGMGVPDDWRTRTRKRYWKIVPLLGLVIQVEPRESTRRMLRDYLNTVVQGRGDLSVKQKKVLMEILRERGAEAQRSWPEERAAHYRALKRRRDLAFRLARLAALDLKPDHAEQVRSLRKQNTAWCGGRMRQLSAGQEDLVKALEAEYHDQRVAAMERLARRLVVILT
jgi:hypothetical protein